MAGLKSVPQSTLLPRLRFLLATGLEDCSHLWALDPTVGWLTILKAYCNGVDTYEQLFSRYWLRPVNSLLL